MKPTSDESEDRPRPRRRAGPRRHDVAPGAPMPCWLLLRCRLPAAGPRTEPTGSHPRRGADRAPRRRPAAPRARLPRRAAQSASRRRWSGGLPSRAPTEGRSPPRYRGTSPIPAPLRRVGMRASGCGSPGTSRGTASSSRDSTKRAGSQCPQCCSATADGRGSRLRGSGSRWRGRKAMGLPFACTTGKRGRRKSRCPAPRPQLPSHPRADRSSRRLPRVSGDWPRGRGSLSA